MTGYEIRIQDDVFSWEYGRSEVSLREVNDGWRVRFTSAGRLLGPRQIAYEHVHHRGTLAAWDVMARVVRACRDEDEGVRVAQLAARWMRSRGYVEAIDR